MQGPLRYEVKIFCPLRWELGELISKSLNEENGIPVRLPLDLRYSGSVLQSGNLVQV